MTTAVKEKYDLEEAIDAIVNRYEAKQTALIMILQDIQKHYRYLPIEALKMVAKKMELPMAQVFGVATFYRSFSLTPKGKHHVCVCTGTACHVRQANVIVDKFQRELGIDPGGTTSDLKFSLETVNCLGACALGPLITVDDSFYGNMTVTKVDKILARLDKGESADDEEEA
jgi:NADH-quinone oxidoreductase subunit E